MLACSHRSARIPARPLVKARSHVALQPGAAADDMSELFSGSFPVPPFVSALLRGLLRRPAPAKPLLCLRPRSGSGSPVPVPPEKPLLVLGAAPTRFRVPETDGQNRRNECTSTELLSSVSSAAMPKRRSATRRTSQCFRSQPKRRGGTTLGRGNPGPNGIDASLSADWLNSPAASLKVLTSPSRASCAATNTSGRSLLAIRGRLSRSESGKSASTPSSNSTAPPSGNQPATATRRCPAKGHFLTRYRKVYPQVAQRVTARFAARSRQSAAPRSRCPTHRRAGPPCHDRAKVGRRRGGHRGRPASPSRNHGRAAATPSASRGDAIRTQQPTPACSTGGDVASRFAAGGGAATVEDGR